MKVKFLSLLMVLITLFVGVCSSANADRLFSFISPCDLVSIDTDTGEVTVIGSVGHGIEALSFSPIGVLFAAAQLNSCGLHGSAHALITVNTQTAEATIIGEIGYGDIDGIAFAPDGTLFGSNTVSLIEIDPVTGVGSAIGPIGFPFVGAMDFSPDGTLFAVDKTGGGGGPSTLLTIDTTTGQGTEIGDVGIDSITGIAFARDGTLFGVSDPWLAGGTGELVIIDPNTGTGTPVTQIIDSGNIDGLAAAPGWGLVYNTLFDDPGDTALPTLRGYRDSIIATDQKGKQLVDELYEKHSDRVANILLTHPELMASAANLTRKHLSGVKSVVNGGKMEITPLQLLEVKRFLSNLAREGSPELRAYIRSVQRMLNEKDLEPFGIEVVSRISAAPSQHRKGHLTATWGAIKNGVRGQ